MKSLRSFFGPLSCLTLLSPRCIVLSSVCALVVAGCVSPNAGDGLSASNEPIQPSTGSETTRTTAPDNNAERQAAQLAEPPLLAGSLDSSIDAVIEALSLPLPAARAIHTRIAQAPLSIVIPADHVGIDKLVSALETARHPLLPKNLAQDSTGLGPGSLWDRIRSGFAMPELKSPLVAKKEKRYLSRPDYMQRMLTRSGRYLFHIVEEIERRGMPTEIALLPFVESAMNPGALSVAKAAGLWQFIPSTGRAYDLKQNWWSDDRRDVVQSTRAALDYLQSLNRMHKGDWFLALASYNWGEGSVNRAIRRNRSRGRPTKYINLRMPRETRHYVPKLIALKNILLKSDELGLALPELLDKPYFVVVENSRPIDLALAAEFAGMHVREFLGLNPAHNRPVIASKRNNRIKIPAEHLERYLVAMDEHESSGRSFVTWQPYTLKKKETIRIVAKRAGLSTKALLTANGLSARRKIISGTRLLVPIRTGADPQNLAKFVAPRVVEMLDLPARYHRVRRRDTLSGVARRWGVSTRTVRRWNGLKSNRIHRGQRLLVRQPSRQTVITHESGKRQILYARATKTLLNRPGRQIAVRRGDTLGVIARRHRVTVRQLKRWNSLKNNRIRIGQKLAVKPESTTVQLASTSTGSGGKRYKVKRGDTLSGIALRHRVSVSMLRGLNKLKNDRIRLGQKLVVSRAPVKVAKRKNALKTTSTTVNVARAKSAAAQHRVRRGDSLSKIAKRYHVSVRDLKRWNKLRKNTIQLGQKLRINASPARLAKSVTTQSNAKPNRKQLASRQTQASHRVRPGDSLGRIAKRYRVTVADLKRWNRIKRNTIHAGDKILLRPAPTLLAKVSVKKPQRATVHRHKVKRGDTLSGIARKYGVSVRSLRRWNGLKNDRIRLGQRLKVNTSQRSARVVQLAEPLAAAETAYSQRLFGESIAA